MGNDNARPACHNALQYLLNEQLRFTIKMNCSFIQIQNVRVFEDYTRQRDELFFTAALGVGPMVNTP